MQKILDMINPWLETLGPIAPYVSALMILIIGFIVVGFIAKKLGRVTTKTLSKGKMADSAAGIGSGVKSLFKLGGIMFVAIIALDVAKLEQALDPLKKIVGEFAGYAPKLIGAGVMLFIIITVVNLIAPMIAGLVNTATSKLKLKFDLGSIVGNLLKGGILLLMLPAILGTAQIPGITEPLTAMVQQITDYLPTLITALVIIGAGGGIAYGIFSVLKPILEATKIDNLVSGLTANKSESSEDTEKRKEKCCNKNSIKPSSLIAMLVGFTVFVPMFVQGLTLLELEFLSEIASGLLGLYAKVLGAVVLLGGTYYGLNVTEPYIKDIFGDSSNTKMVKFGVLGYVAIIALSNLGISGVMIDYPFKAFVTAAAVAVGLGGAFAIGASDSLRKKISELIEK